MPLAKVKPEKKKLENASVSLITDPTNALLLVEALNDIQRSLKTGAYKTVMLSIGPKKNSPQISIKDEEEDWQNVQGATLITALINYGKMVTNATEEED
jgi:hypothetical protein